MVAEAFKYAAESSAHARNIAFQSLAEAAGLCGYPPASLGPGCYAISVCIREWRAVFHRQYEQGTNTILKVSNCADSYGEFIHVGSENEKQGDNYAETTR